jgi:hypothetical protein
MSEYRMDDFPAHSVERPGWAARLADWFRPQQFRERAYRRDRAADEAQRINEIKWLWRQACEVSGLGRLVFVPSGPAMSIPMIGQVTLGEPTTFTVRPQPGQLLADFQAAAPRVAAAMGAGRVVVRPLVAEWIVVELLDACTPPSRSGLPQVVPFTPRGGRPQPGGDAAAA